jgi:hypothetical protein
MRDLLDWLLPGVSASEAARVRRLITVLRLHRDDARAGAPRIETGPRSGAAELRRLEHQRRARTLEGLLHAWITRLCSTDSFLVLGPPPLSYEECLRRALDDGVARSWLPRPGEPARAGLERLLRRGPELGPGVRELWGARRVHVLEGPERAGPRWSEALRTARRVGSPLALQATLLAGRVAACLDRFDPRSAWELFAGGEVLASLEPALCSLMGWSALACGHQAAARELLGAAGSEGAVPPALAEMLHALGLGPAPPEPGAASVSDPSSRRALGATVLGTFVLAGEHLRVHALEAAPALRARLLERLSARDGAWLRPGEPDHELVQSRSPVRRDLVPADPEGRLRGALGGPRSRALALVPLLEGPRLRGWLHVESEHHLLPSRARLRALAAARCAELEPLAVVVSPTAEVRRAPLPADDPRAAFLEALSRATWKSVGQRRVHLVQVAGRTLEVLAELGDALEDGPEVRGPGRAIWRALADGRATSYRGPEEGLHLAAHLGLVLPLGLGVDATTEAAVVVECARRPGICGWPEDLEALRRAWLPAWRAAAFRAWHRGEHDRDLAWDPTHRFPAEAQDLALGAARAGTPLLIRGAPGSGRRTLARLVHFLATGGRRGTKGTGSGGLRVLDLETHESTRLTGPVQATEGDSRTTVVLAPADGRSGDRGAVSALVGELDPLSLEVPGLCDRREEIPALANVLLHDRARRERVTPVLLDDSARAALWRQVWRGQVSELDAVCGWITRRLRGREAGAEAVRLACESLHLPYRERLPSRRPRAGELRQAIDSTRHASGASNRARAARFLGWDPDTLRRRLRDTPGEPTGR